MPLDDDLITRATLAFDPLGELNERNVEALYTPRPESPAQRAARRIQRLQTPSRFVLVGARGAGKMTLQPPCVASSDPSWMCSRWSSPMGCQDEAISPPPSGGA